MHKSEIRVAGIEIENLHKVQLEVLREFKSVCSEHNLSYSLYAGTLIGAIRHEGFIPWDDDVDVIMPRNDYDKFIEIYESNTNYFLQTYKSDDGYLNQYAKLRKNGTIMIEELSRYQNIHEGVFLDIFPYDKVPNSKVENYTLFAKLRIINMLKTSLIVNVERYHNSFFKKIMIKTFRVIAKKIGRYKLLNYEENLITKYRNLNTEIMLLSSEINRNTFFKQRFQNNLFSELITVQFESEVFSIIKSYDLMLKKIYGNYTLLPEKKERKPTHDVIKLEL